MLGKLFKKLNINELKIADKLPKCIRKTIIKKAQNKN